MPRLRPLLALLPALLAGACGGSDTPSTKFIAQSRAADFQATLDTVEQDLEADRCDRAAVGIDRLRAQAEGWPDAYDSGLVSNVLQWIDRIEVRIGEDCGAEETPTPPPAETPTPTEAPTEPSPTETPTQTPSPTPTPTETPSETPEAPATPEAPEVPTPDGEGESGTGGAEGDGQGQDG